MSDTVAASESEARYVSINDVAYELADGCAKTFRKCLLTTERVSIHQTSIRGRGLAENYGTRRTNRVAYVLSGAAMLEHTTPTQIRAGQLIVIPSGVRWGERLSLRSDELVLLEVARAVDETSTVSASPPGQRIHVVDPASVPVYEPAGHAKTQNRCLFVDAHMELIEGLIDRGGGADRHAHRDNEQMLYVLDIGQPLLIYYPKSTPHGTGGGIAEPLHLLVIYSPPLGESQNALG